MRPRDANCYESPAETVSITDLEQAIIITVRTFRMYLVPRLLIGHPQRPPPRTNRVLAAIGINRKLNRIR